MFSYLLRRYSFLFYRGKVINLLHIGHELYEKHAYYIKSAIKFFFRFKTNSFWGDLLFCSQKYCIFAVSLPYQRSIRAEVGQTYISVMAFLDALVLTNWNLANSSTSQEQSSKERLIGCIISSPYWLQAICRLLPRGFIYTLTWGFLRCSFRLVGQCESLNSWNE